MKIKKQSYIEEAEHLFKIFSAYSKDNVEFKEKEENLIFKLISEIYLSIVECDPDLTVNLINSLKNRVSQFEVNQKLINGYLNVCYLGSLVDLNRIIHRTLESENIPLDSIRKAILSMFIEEDLNIQTVLVLDKNVMPAFRKELKDHYIGERDTSMIIDALKMWEREVREYGIVRVSKNKKWRDHKLGKREKWIDHRSVELTYSARLIYKVTREQAGKEVTLIVEIVRITATHDYS